MKIRNFFMTCASVGALIVTAAYAAETYQTDIKTGDKSLGHLERANKLIGKTVYTSDNQKVGKLENFAADLESGRVLFGVIGTGILGVGGHDYAVPPSVFADSSGETLRLTIDKAKLQGAPEFSSNVDKPEQLGQASFVSQVYQYFGQPAWWQGGSTTTTSSSQNASFRNVHKAKDLIGMKVKNVSNEDVGKVENLMVNLPAGRIAFVVLNPDSSLNLGNNLYSLPPNAITWNSDQKMLVSDINRDKLAAAPHIEKEQWSMLSDPAFASKIYQYYGKQAYFESGGTLKPTGKDAQRDYQTK